MLRCDSGVDTLETPLVERERDDELLLEREIGVNADAEDGTEKSLSERNVDAEDGTEKSLSEREIVWLLEREIGVDKIGVETGADKIGGKTGADKIGCDDGKGGCDAGTGGCDAGTAEGTRLAS